ncbi:11088_t:CDS:2, partial [Dentiscutata heterogama]
MFIFFKEFYGNDKFHQWARQNVFASSVFIVLSYCDIESLDFISSGISKSSCVQAPFSQVGKASASRRMSSRKHPHFLSGFVPIQPDPATQV